MILCVLVVRLEQLVHSYMDVWVAIKRFLAARIKVTRAKFVEVHGMMQLENRDQSNA